MAIRYNRSLWVLACMDERLPVDEALGIYVDTPAGGGDAHCFRNAGGIVTDDAIRSAMLTCNFFGTDEIVIVQHTQCGMLSANAADLEAALFKKKGVDVDNVTLDPTLPELKPGKRVRSPSGFMMDDVDDACLRTIAAFKNHPLPPRTSLSAAGFGKWKHVVCARRPRTLLPRLGRTDVTSAQFGVKGKTAAAVELSETGDKRCRAMTTVAPVATPSSKPVTGSRPLGRPVRGVAVTRSWRLYPLLRCTAIWRAAGSWPCAPWSQSATRPDTVQVVPAATSP